MKGLWKGIQWVLWLIAAVVVAFLLNVAYFRWRGPTPAQQAALDKVLAPSPMPEGENAFAWILLFDKDVDDAEITQLAERDVESARAIAPGGIVDKLPSSSLPTLPVPASDSAAICMPKQAGCLALIRTNPEATRSELALHGRLLERANKIEQADYLRSGFPETVMPPLQYGQAAQRLRLSSLALSYLDGQHEQALAGVCQNLSAWRRFGESSRSILQTMVAGSNRDASLQLFAEMLAGLDPGDTIPPSCEQALAVPVAAEVSLFRSLIGEFRFADAILMKVDSDVGPDSELSWWDRLDRWLSFSYPQTRAWRAADVAGYCTAAADERVMRDDPVFVATADIGRLACASNLNGCVYGPIDARPYEDYQRRLLDAAAHLRLAATVLWLRQTRDDPRSLNERFAARPQSLHSGTRDSGIAEDGASIWVDNLHQHPETRFSLPLAPPMEVQP